MSTHLPFGAMPPAAIVFDCDGLLLDTEGCWTAGQTALFERHRRAFEPEHKQALVGRSMAEAGPIYERFLGRPGRGADLTDELVALVVDELEQTGCTPMPGAVELLGMLRGRAPLGVASNAPRPVFEAAVAAAGVADWFEAAVSADDVERPKPAPDIYLEACRRLGADPADAVALEDTATGLAAARAAGMRTIGVPSVSTVALEADVTAGSLLDPAVLAALGLATDGR
jgi:HAD superfamily hydrolase (TIGR01509 family)